MTGGATNPSTYNAFQQWHKPFIPHIVDTTFAIYNVHMHCTCVIINKGSNALRSAAIGAASIQVANRNTPPRRHLANIPAAVERDVTDYATDARHQEQLDYSYKSKLVTDRDAEIPRGMGGPGLQQLVQLGHSLAPAPMIIAVTTYGYLLTAINFAATIKRHVNESSTDKTSAGHNALAENNINASDLLSNLNHFLTLHSSLICTELRMHKHLN